MKNKIIIITTLLVGVMLLGFSSAMTINYFYSPSCPHCQQVNPLINFLSSKYKSYNWAFFDVSQTSYDISGVPTIKIKTNDCRNIELVGSYEIEKYLNCELQEMSTAECKTNINQKRGSYFIE